MTRENRNLIINALIALLASVILVMSYSFIKTGASSKYDDMFGFETSITDKENINVGSVISKQEVKNKENQVVGFVYVLEGEGEYYGDQTGKVILELVIKNDLTILGYEFITYEHTEGEQFKGKVEAFLDEIVISQLKINEVTIDSGNTTGATNSRTIIVNMIKELNDYLDDNVGENPSQIFKDKHIVEEEQTTDGFIFTLDTGMVNYDFGTDKVVIKVNLNTDLTITSYEFVEYNHTAGFKDNVDDFLKKMIDEKISIITIKPSDANDTGSTRTLTALLTMFNGLSDYIKDIYGDVEEPEIPTINPEEYKNNHILYQRETDTGFVFIVDSLDVEFRKGSYANFVIKIEVNKDLELLSYEFADYNHTNRFQAAVIIMLDNLVTEKIKINELVKEDAGSGSTFSINAVINLLTDVSKYIEAGIVENEVIDPEDEFNNKHIIYQNNDVYLLDSLDVVYRDNGAKDNFVIKVELNQDLELVSYSLLDYNHSGGNHKDRVIELLETIITTKTKIIDLEELPENSQTTLSKNAVISLLKNLGIFIKQRDTATIFKEAHLLYQETTKNSYIFILDSLDVPYTDDRFANFVIKVEISFDLELINYHFIDYNHTESLQVAVNELLDDIIANKIKISDLENELAGSGTTLSKNAIIDLLRNLSDYINFGLIENDPIDEENKFENKHILYTKEDKDGNLIYLLDSLEVEFRKGGYANFVIKITISKNQEILDYEFVVYNHTAEFQDEVLVMLDEIKTNRIKLTDLIDAENQSGSTYSKNAIINLLRGLGTRITEIEFAKKFSSEQVIYQKKTNAGYVLIIDSLDVEFRNGRYANFVMKLEINNSFELVTYEFIEYNHTLSYQDKVIVLLDEIIANKIKIFDLVEEVESGSTYSKNAVIKVMKDTLDYINAGFIDLELDEAETFLEKHVLNYHTTTEKVDEIDIFYSNYTLDSLDVVYRDNGAKDNFVIKVKLDSELKITTYSFIDYNHTSGYQTQVIEMLNQMVEQGIKLSELSEVQEGAGSTKTKNAVINLLIDLASYIGGEQ